MSFFYIDESKNYELKLDRNAVIHIPEIREVADDKKLGWNFVYYAFLFCSRAPLGRMPDAVRDQRIAEIVDSFPFNSGDPRNVGGFYKHKKFPQLRKVITEMYPDTLYDTYQSTMNMIEKLRTRRDNIDLDNDEEIVKLEVYNEQIQVLIKQAKSLEVDMMKSLNSKTVTFGAGSLQKDI